MKYKDIVEGIFIKRINRFIAEVKINNIIQKVHVKNTGRCKELFIEGTKIYLQQSNNPERKTKYSLISIYKGNKLINIDSQIPNFVVYEGIKSGLISEFNDISYIKKEKKYNNSRFDIYYKRKNGKEGFIEIKGVTLENNGTAMFPDAPTSRGRKHINEMIQAVKEGYEGNIFFLIQMDGINKFISNDKTDPEFGKALRIAYKSRVNVFVYNSIVTKDTISINKKANYIL